MRILVVDDDPQNRDLIGRLLEHLGYETVPIESGTAAVEAVSAVPDEEIGTVFLDYMMPGMNGVETAAKIRTIQGRETVPIVILSGIIISGDELTIPGPPPLVLLKPVRLSDLKAVMDQITGGT